VNSIRFCFTNAVGTLSPLPIIQCVNIKQAQLGQHIDFIDKRWIVFNIPFLAFFYLDWVSVSLELRRISP
jgi:hypothetical protein